MLNQIHSHLYGRWRIVRLKSISLVVYRHFGTSKCGLFVYSEFETTFRKGKEKQRVDNGVPMPLQRNCKIKLKLAEVYRYI